MRPLIFIATLYLLCSSACAASMAQKSPDIVQTTNIDNGNDSKSANLLPKPVPTITAKDTKKTNSNQQTQCSKEFQNETVKYKELPKEVKAKIDETARNKYSKFIKLTYQSIEDPSAKEPRCQTYIDFNTREYWDGNEVPEKQNIGWTFVRVGEHWEYIPPYTPKKKQRRK